MEQNNFLLTFKQREKITLTILNLILAKLPKKSKTKTNK